MAKLIKIAETKDLPPGKALAFDVEGLRIAVFNVGGTEPISLKDLASRLVHIARGASVECVPWPQEKKAIDIGSFYSDSRKLMARTGWQPLVSIDDGFRETVKFYRANLSQYVSESAGSEEPS